MDVLGVCWIWRGVSCAIGEGVYEGLEVYFAAAHNSRGVVFGDEEDVHRVYGLKSGFIRVVIWCLGVIFFFDILIDL